MSSAKLLRSLMAQFEEAAKTYRTLCHLAVGYADSRRSIYLERCDAGLPFCSAVTAEEWEEAIGKNDLFAARPLPFSISQRFYVGDIQCDTAFYDPTFTATMAECLAHTVGQNIKVGLLEFADLADKARDFVAHHGKPKWRPLAEQRHTRTGPDDPYLEPSDRDDILDWLTLVYAAGVWNRKEVGELVAFRIGNVFGASLTALEIMCNKGITLVDDPALAQHSTDFRSVDWYGTEYTFTSNQAAVVKLLWENWERGTPEVSDATLLVHAEIQSKRLDVTFRDSPAWGTMIVGGSGKGTRRLNPPNS